MREEGVLHGPMGCAFVCSEPTRRAGLHFSRIPTLASWSGSAVSQTPSGIRSCVQVPTWTVQFLAGGLAVGASHETQHYTLASEQPGRLKTSWAVAGSAPPSLHSSSSRLSQWRSDRWIRTTTLALGKPNGLLREQVERSLLCYSQSYKLGTQLSCLQHHRFLAAGFEPVGSSER